MLNAIWMCAGAFIGTMLGNLVWYSILKFIAKRHEYDEPNGQ